MATEESPLLGEVVDAAVLKHEEVYNRFKPAQKRTITALISLAGLVPCACPDRASWQILAVLI